MSTRIDDDVEKIDAFLATCKISDIMSSSENNSAVNFDAAQAVNMINNLSPEEKAKFWERQYFSLLNCHQQNSAATPMAADGFIESNSSQNHLPEQQTAQRIQSAFGSAPGSSTDVSGQLPVVGQTAGAPIQLPLKRVQPFKFNNRRSQGGQKHKTSEQRHLRRCANVFKYMLEPPDQQNNRKKNFTKKRKLATNKSVWAAAESVSAPNFFLRNIQMQLEEQNNKKDESQKLCEEKKNV